jgi:hypothetical protein
LAASISDATGAYDMTGIPPDTYLLIEMDLLGYFSTTPNEVVVRPGTSAIVNFGDRLSWRTFVPTFFRSEFPKQ